MAARCWDPRSPTLLPVQGGCIEKPAPPHYSTVRDNPFSLWIDGLFVCLQSLRWHPVPLYTIREGEWMPTTMDLVRPPWHWQATKHSQRHFTTVFPCGSHTSPGAQAGVPVILPTELTVRHLVWLYICFCHILYSAIVRGSRTCTGWIPLHRLRGPFSTQCFFLCCPHSLVGGCVWPRMGADGGRPGGRVRRWQWGSTTPTPSGPPQSWWCWRWRVSQSCDILTSFSWWPPAVDPPNKTCSWWQSQSKRPLCFSSSTSSGRDSSLKKSALLSVCQKVGYNPFGIRHCFIHPCLLLQPCATSTVWWMWHTHWFPRTLSTSRTILDQRQEGKAQPTH